MTSQWSDFASPDLSKHSRDFANLFEHEDATLPGHLELESIGDTFKFGETDPHLDGFSNQFRFGEPDATAIESFNRPFKYSEASTFDEALWSPNAFSFPDLIPSPILCLPPTIRHEIWSYATDDSIDVVVNDRWDSLYPASPLLRICKIIRSDLLFMATSRPEMITHTVNEPLTLIALRNFNHFPASLLTPPHRLTIRLKLSFPLLEGALRNVVMMHCENEARERIRCRVMRLWNLGFRELVRMGPAVVLIDAAAPWGGDVDYGIDTESALHWQDWSEHVTRRMGVLYYFYKKTVKHMALYWMEDGDWVDWPMGLDENVGPQAPE